LEASEKAPDTLLGYGGRLKSGYRVEWDEDCVWRKEWQLRCAEQAPLSKVGSK
jgi:hypothetical protein